MPYTTVENVTALIETEELARLTEGADGEVGGVIFDALARVVDGRIDNALFQAGYIVPVENPPDYLTGLAARLMLGHLYGRRLNSDPPEMLQKLWRYAENELDQLERGSRQIDAPRIAASASNITVISQPTRGWREAE